MRACGALPLALRIVGAKLAARPSWPLAAMVRRIAGGHDRLSELQAGDLSVRASIASSYESLPDRLRRGFRLLARVAELINLQLLGTVLAWLENGDQVVTFSEAAVAVAADLGLAPYKLAALHSIAYSCMRAGQYERAVSLSLERIELSRKIGNARSEGVARGVLGDAYQRMGEHELAAECLLQAIPLFQNQHAHRYHALSLLKLGHAYEGLGRCPEAISYLEQSMAMFRQLRLPHMVNEAQQALDRCKVRDCLR